MSSHLPAGRLPALTGLRFIAALSIFALHFLPDLPASASRWQGPFSALRDAGISGVPMFFALSGFILTYAYAGMRADASSIKAFFIQRVARIYPIYLVGMLWFAPFALYHRFTTEPASLAWTKVLVGVGVSAPLMQTWFHPMLAISWNGPGWSLSVEAMLYLIFPWVLPRMMRLSVGALRGLALVALGASLAWSWGLPWLLRDWAHMDALVDFSPFGHMPAFVYGMALGGLLVKRPGSSRLSHVLAPAGAMLYTALAMWSPQVPAHVLHNTLMLPAFGMVFLGLARGGLGSQWLATRPMALLGEASYGLYILQFGMAMTFTWLVHGLAIHDYWGKFSAYQVTDFTYFAGLLAFCVGMSLVTYRWMEAPWRQSVRAALTRRWLPQKGRTPAAAMGASGDQGAEGQGRKAA